VFLSDHEGEIQAASAAGLQTVLLAREAGQASSAYARSFDELSIVP
jgi:methionine salvage enolase-phosphatase E1